MLAVVVLQDFLLFIALGGRATAKHETSVVVAIRLDVIQALLSKGFRSWPAARLEVVIIVLLLARFHRTVVPYTIPLPTDGGDGSVWAFGELIGGNRL